MDLWREIERDLGRNDQHSVDQSNQFYAIESASGYILWQKDLGDIYRHTATTKDAKSIFMISRNSVVYTSDSLPK